MEVNCEGCAGCCLDWRPLDAPGDREREGRYRALDDTYHLVPLSRDEVGGFIDDGLGDALVPRLFATDGARHVEIDGHRVAAIDGRPAFLVGLRKTPKPVAPFDGDRVWLDACAFLDPDTLRCRIHGTERYPDRCRTYPGHNLELDAETECERVERVHGAPGDRLRDDTVPEDLPPPPLGRGALGSTVFLHPDPEALDGAVGRLVAGESTREDRASFVAAAAASAPGTGEVNAERFERERERVLAADSWVGAADAAWRAVADERGSRVDDGATPAAATVETDRGAPPTGPWDGGE